MSKITQFKSAREAVLLLGFLASASLPLLGASPALGPKHTPQAVVDGSAKLVNRFAGNQMMRLVIALQPPHPVEEQKFLDDVHTKGTPVFHQFLTPEQWIARFSPSAQDEQMVAEWAESAGLHITQRYPNRAIVAVEAPAATIERALGITINHYMLAGSTFFSNDRDPQIPSQLTGVVQSVLGLNSRAMLHSHMKGAQENNAQPVYVAGPEVATGEQLKHDATTKKIPASLARPSSSGSASASASGPTPGITSGRYDPTDLYGSNAYNYGALSAQKHCCNPYGNPGNSPPEASIGIATAYDYVASDLNGFLNQYTYLAANIQPYYIGGTSTCPTSNPTCNGETTLDTEWATAMSNSFGSYADTAQVHVYQGVDNSFATFTKIFNQMLTDNKVRVVSTSWGCAESTCYDSSDMDAQNNLFAQMTGQGWTVVASSDDNGATALSGANPASCTTSDSVDFPASSPNVVAAGGTTLYLYSDSTYDTEVAWTGSTYSGACAQNNGGSGGGFSSYYSAPYYQNPFGFAKRGVPDLALNANYGQNYFYNGSLQSVGGTSIVAPELAGFFAQENAYLLALGNVCGNNDRNCAPMGNANYYIYYEGQNPSYAQHFPFYDITSGCNSNDVTALYRLTTYCASSGYDEVTGWGSANMLQLAWAINTYLAFDGGRPYTAFSGPSTGVWYKTDQNVTWSTADTGNGRILGLAGFSQAWDTDPGDVSTESTPGSGNSFYSGPQFPKSTTGYLALSWAGQGCHTAYVRSWDNAGLSGLQTYGRVCYDTIAPTTYAVLSPGANNYGYYKSNVQVTLTASDPGTGSGTGSGVYVTYYSVDNASCTPSNPACNSYTGPFTITAPGSHIVRFFSSDHAGNVQAAQALYVYIDETAPVTTGSVSGTYLTGHGYTTPVTMTLSRTDNLSGVQATMYQVDGGTALTYSAPFTINGVGTHHIAYHSTDYAGNVETMKTWTITIVNKLTSATTLTASSSSTTPAQSVTFTANVAPAAATGTVTFKDGSNVLGTSGVSSGKAVFSLVIVGNWTHAIRAVYSGDNTYLTSTSAPLSHTVAVAPTTTTISSDTNPSQLDIASSFRATVTSSGGTVAGTVTFKDGSATLGTVTLNAYGKAVLYIALKSIGTHSLQVVYNGTSSFGSSTSSVLTQVVNRIVSTTVLSTPTSTSPYGKSVTFTAQVSPVYASFATGTITFKDGATVLATATLSYNKAFYTTSSLGKWTHQLSAVYSGDSNYLGSTSAKLPHTVN